MRIVSWNVNSLKARIGRVQGFLERHDPDILGLQETKLKDGEFPFFGFPEHHHVAYGTGTYNGVAFLSKEAPDETRRGFPGNPATDQARAITSRWGDLWVMNLYVVNGKHTEDPAFVIKQQWLQGIKDFLESEFDPNQELVVMGDFNITPTDLDSHMGEDARGMVHHTTEERRWLQDILDWGLIDTHRQLTDEQVFTWWDYRGLGFPQNKGLRIDLALGTESFAKRVENVWVDRDERKVGDHAEKPSDHAPLVVDARFE